MANEFKIKNGFFSEGNSNITGSLNVSAGITGSLLGTASYATQALSASWAPGGTGTVTSVGTTGTVNGITLTGGPITGAGTITLGGTLSGIGNAQLTNSSVTVGSTNIALGATSTILAGLTSVTSTNFTGSLLGTASNAITSLTASKVITQGSLAGGNQYFLIYQSNPAGGTAAEVSTSNLVYNSTTNTLPTTASWATNAVTASYALNALSASYATQALSSSYALTASNSQNAQDILIYVKNVTGAQINKGKVVRISGATGDNALIATASYESDGLSANTLGITSQDIPNDSFGYVITEGTLIGINTNAFSAGQLLYLGATGSIIGTAPVAPLHAVRLGQVLRVQINNGSMYVRIDNGYELGELHDVVDTTTTSSYGDLLVKSGSVWINSKQLTGSYGLTGSLNATSFTGSLLGTASYATQALSASFATSTAAVAGTTNYVSKFTSGTTIGNSLIYDNGTNVGIGTTSPAAKVHISGSGAVQRLESNGTFTALDFYNTTAAANSRNWSIGSNLYNYGDFNIMNSVSSGSAPTSANTYLTINKDGKVGVNTIAPIYNLDVAASSTSDGIRITQGGTSKIIAYGDGVLNWGAAADYGTLTWDTGKAIVKGLSGKALSLGANNGNDQLYISTAGNVGINTTSPNSKLHVVGDTSISGSLITSGSDGKGINTSTTILNGGFGVGNTVNWGSGELIDDNSITSVNWLSSYSLTAPSFGGVTTVQWGAGWLKSLNTSMSIDWDTRVAYDTVESKSIDWENRVAFDYLGLLSIDWISRGLLDTSEIISVDWDSRILYDSTGADSVGWDGRFLLSAASGIKALDWNSDYWLASPSYQKDAKSIDLQDTVSGLGASDDTYLGDIIDGRVDGINYPSNGQVVYLETDGFWYAYDQGDTNIYGKMVGLVFRVDSGFQTCKVLLEGHVLIDNTIGPGVQGVDHGLPVYIKYQTTTGEMETGSPSSGIVQVLGHCYYQNITTSDYWMMKFRPSVDWYKAT